MNLKEYVDVVLTNTDRHAIIQSYEKFEKQGFIGDEPVRTWAEQYMTIVNASDTSVVVWMQMLAFECYRYYYHEHQTA